MNIPDLLREAAARLSGGSDTARLDAELLMAHALGIGRADMLMRQRDLDPPDGFAALVERRAGGEPLAYITGSRDFWTITLAVTPAVLIPRPDSETLIEAAVDHFAGTAGPSRILDLGVGSGALLLAALDQWPVATGIGVDMSDAALGVARANAVALGMADRADMRTGDWAAGIEERFDLILANPPYIVADAVLARDVIDHEPHGALFAGADGLDNYRRIAPALPRLLTPGGMAAIEIGYDQSESVGALLAAQGLSVAMRRDLGGHVRCLIARLAADPA
ncbi:release factor glutamine methyltransferase [Sphingobium fontiphilum]|uniref:Release factor glutamine methyltransferase n=1 Tax=Sphingobium fontiphilum TaxID=944425 RepID=A0A7W6GPL1_9SPHN|nr:release factor glutamine methyltransferase [Sphingobium fontiphilum]